MSLFEAELAVLGVGVEEAVAMDEAGLRQVFRARSLELHPDVVGAGAEEGRDEAGGGGAGVPTIYELNEAYEAVKKVLS